VEAGTQGSVFQADATRQWATTATRLAKGVGRDAGRELGVGGQRDASLASGTGKQPGEEGAEEL
jgi:hypothetical protein